MSGRGQSRLCFAEKAGVRAQFALGYLTDLVRDARPDYRCPDFGRL